LAAHKFLRLSACCLAGSILYTSGCASNNVSTPGIGAAPATATGFASGSWLTRLWNSEPERPVPPEAVVDDSELDNPERLHLTYARWQEDLGNHHEARKSYEQVLELDPRNAQAVLGLARIDQAAGRTQQAEQGFQKAVQLKPREPAPLAELGQFYASQNRWKEAIATLQMAASLAPNEPAYQHYLAATVARSGDSAAAIPLFTKAVGEAEAYYNVGCILYEQGRLDQAERYFHQALSKRPDLEPARKMLAEVRRQDSTATSVATAPPAPRAVSHQGGDRVNAQPAPSLPAISSRQQTAPPPARPQRVDANGVLVEQFVVPVEYRIEEPEDVAGWNPTKKRQAAALTPAVPPGGLTPEQREQWANQSR
jgi:tetratricopeptide (TPR) repeat protein